MTENKEKQEEFDDVVSVDDEAIDEAELEDIEEHSAQNIKKTKLQLKNCEAEKMEHLENLQRAKAEFLNAKRRLEDERKSDKERAIVNQIEKLLPLCDSFQMAMSNKEAWEAIDPTWRKGIDSIYNQLQSILSSYGVSEVTPVGEVFNPAIHDAMINVSVTSKEDHHKIISVIQNGFVRKVGDTEQLIRPARVTVGEYTE
jgi:molecular chaperone GrpE